VTVHSRGGAFCLLQDESRVFDAHCAPKCLDPNNTTRDRDWRLFRCRVSNGFILPTRTATPHVLVGNAPLLSTLQKIILRHAVGNPAVLHNTVLLDSERSLAYRGPVLVRKGAVSGATDHVKRSTKVCALLRSRAFPLPLFSPLVSRDPGRSAVSFVQLLYYSLNADGAGAILAPASILRQFRHSLW
jgi:hypothetical protein